MATFISFWAGFTIFVTCCAVAFVMSYAGGKVIDTVHERALDAGILKSPGTANEYQLGTEPMLNFIINFYYFIMYALPVFGALVFGQSIMVRLRQDRYTY